MKLLSALQLKNFDAKCLGMALKSQIIKTFAKQNTTSL